MRDNTSAQRCPAEAAPVDGAAISLLDFLGVAVVGVGHEGAARPLNAKAAAMLAARRWLRLAAEGGALTAASLEDTRSLRRLVRAALDGVAGPPVALSIGDGDGGRLHLLVARAAGPDGLSAAVFVMDPAARRRPDPETLRRWFALSAREAQLASWLAGGHSLDEAAAGLGITVGTARTHLKRVFAKTGVSGQGRLVSLLGAYPVMPEAFARD